MLRARVLASIFTCLCLITAATTSLAQATTRDDIRVGIQLEPPVLDPTITAAAAAGEITYCNVLEGLTVVDAEGRIAPRLAESWRLSSDGLTYEFNLQDDVRFHDGSHFNAEVAAFSLNRIIARDSHNPQKKLFEKVRGIDVLDKHRIAVRLTQPDALLPYALAQTAAVIVHPDSVDTNATHPIGTGPFRFAEWEAGRSVTLLRNDDYWSGKARLTRAQFLFMQTSVGTENMLAEGLVDGLVSVTRLTNRFMVRPDYQMRERKLESKLLLAINNARPPFNDLRVRRALAHAVDRRGLLDLYGSELRPKLIGSHFPPSHPAYVDLVERYPYDPDRARALLAEAGVKPGTRVELTIPPTDYGRYGSVRIAEDLEAVGFSVELKPVEWKEWMQDVFKDSDYALTLIMHVEPMDLNIYARDNYYFNYDNAGFKPIWDQVLNARSEAELNARLGDAQRRITEDAVNVFLFMRPEQNLMHRNLTGLWEKSPIPAFVLEDIYWTQ
ncbi:ABC transporter substrate-binding protein [Marinobacterium zhoushanense]|uniref:ABC transporter substrate-binding protein n=1 Tax=Marinobacterium zhoushanense TaxID=1679163 RepID=A0ABQ1KNG5_9GAMM|nr:ABC transporter substrate-binding protein [Marinobacterium zhoushanense]GGC05871.1 ABC transporter substrate-binding protein [Marinobacterium zhoushanense]